MPVVNSFTELEARFVKFVYKIALLPTFICAIFDAVLINLRKYVYFFKSSPPDCRIAVFNGLP